MDSIQDIVNVIITRETTAVAETGFGTVMILGASKRFNERLRFYTSLSAMSEDGFVSTDPEYKAAQAVFAQSPRPERIAIGRRSVDSSVVTVSTVNDTALYTITINGVAHTYQAVEDDTGTIIATALKNAINAGAQPVTASNVNDVITIVADTSGTAYTLSVDSKMTITSPYTTSDTVANDLDAINLYNSDWYGLVLTSRTAQAQEDAADWVEANKKLLGLATADPNVLDSEDTSDIAYIVSNGNYDRTFVLYHDDAATSYPEAAWFGRMLPTNPGTANWANKDLNGVDTVALTTTQRTTIQDKNANTYELRGGAPIVRLGQVGSGEYIDVIVGIDWLESRIVESVYNRLVNLPKIPYTDPGIAIIEAELRKVLDLAVARDVLAKDPVYTVTVPKAIDVSAQDKANRTLNGVEFLATLSGAINSVTIRGVVTV